MVLRNELQLLQATKALVDGFTGGMRSLLVDPSFISLAREYEKNKGRRVVNVGLNLFVLISDVYHRENFHSDILQVLLDPKSPHKEGNKYLHLFLELVGRKMQGLHIDVCDFENATVVREKNRIDLLICDPTSKKAIIIENKMNNAWDMPRQIPRYVSKVKAEGYQCEAIVYLRLNNVQLPDGQILRSMPLGGILGVGFVALNADGQRVYAYAKGRCIASTCTFGLLKK